MMQVSGLSSLQYFIGMLLADMFLWVFPSLAIAVGSMTHATYLTFEEASELFLASLAYGLPLITMGYMYIQLLPNR